MRIVIAITGASGAVFGRRLLEVLVETGAEVHLVVSTWGMETLRLEAGLSEEALNRLPVTRHGEFELGAPIASGSFPFDGMAVVPCSMKTLACIANGISHNLICRAADVAIKERRRLILGARETPLSAIHLENMLRLARAGVVIMPPVPSFYGAPARIEDIVDQYVGRVLDHLGIENSLVKRWRGSDGGRALREGAVDD
jgi:4-hydroxy-3-polyprenylbenzoate decarboxylase